MRLIFLFLFSASLAYSQEDITSVKVETIIEDPSLNVRALEIFNREVYFASSDGRVMKYSDSAHSTEVLWPMDTLNSPNFRSLAVTPEGIFALAIESPALLYKNGQIVYREDHEKAFYDSMEFWNDMEGIAMGDPTGSCISVIITRDGGDTWTKVPCTSLPNAKDGEAAFAASDTNVKTIGENTWIATGGKASRILYSPDKGETWSIYNTTVVQGEATTGLYSIDFCDPLHGYGIGGDYTQPNLNARNKIITSDGGKTWKVVAADQDPGYRSCIQFVPESNCGKLFAIGFKGIDCSNDGGTTWTHLSDEGFYTIRFMNAKTAFAAGNGRVSKLTFE